MATSKKAKILKNFWEGKLKEWKESGQNGHAWCQANQLPYHQFSYWRKTLLPKKSASLLKDRSPFVEITKQAQEEQSKKSGVELKWHQVTLSIEESFNQTALKNILQVIQELSPC